jgi:flagellar protein FlaG
MGNTVTTMMPSPASDALKTAQAPVTQRATRMPERVTENRSVTTNSSPVASEPARPPTDKELVQAVESVQRVVEAKAPNEVMFSIDSDTGRSVVRIVDQQTGETLRQIPPQELIDISKSLEKMQGLLLRGEA